jgi:thymidylate synthase (FAD)
MKIEVLHCSPLWIIVEGIRTCWKTQEKSDTNIATDTLGEKDKELIRKIIRFGHTSTLEHSLITYRISGISRALLQELSRHRVGVSPSVESTRYTFKRILNGEEYVHDTLMKSGDPDLDNLNLKHMLALKDLVNKKGLPNDVAKYGLVESFTLNETVSFNIRSLRHFYQLRSSKKALLEIRQLANELLTSLPPQYIIFFEDLIE